ncbi:hypothetical protein [Pantoea ananatis]|uniref:hypothetical protein n=1 Tax=Pantoea ananas TaxID=553 RepID=UPI003FA45FDF
MAPTLIGDNYAKDLSKPPSLSGGFFVSKTHTFLLPEDTRVFRLVETTYDSADYNFIAVVQEISFHSQDFVEDQIDNLRDEGLSDEEIVERIMHLGMENEDENQVIARFAYDRFSFLDQTNQLQHGVQIRGAYVDPEKSGVGFAGQVYRQLVIIYGHLVCDNTQTEFGASLWAGTIRDVVGRVDIYDCAKQAYLEELGDLSTGVRGCIPWDLSVTANHSNLTLSRWKNYPFSISGCRYLVLIVSA